MDGLAVGVICYRDPDDAAAAACSAVSGVTSAGVASCEAPSVTGGVLSYTLNVDSAAGRVSRAVSVSLPQCEPFDMTSYGPVLAAFFLAGVVIVSARMVYTKVFNRETF
jgi:hypothetical protein